MSDDDKTKDDLSAAQDAQSEGGSLPKEPPEDVLRMTNKKSPAEPGISIGESRRRILADEDRPNWNPWRDRSYDAVLCDIPVNTVYQYLEEASVEFREYPQQSEISAVRLAQSLKAMDYYHESTSTEYLAHLIHDDADFMEDIDHIKLKTLISMQALALNALVHHMMGRYADQQANPDLQNGAGFAFSTRLYQ